jgi:hypothetical protein
VLAQNEPNAGNRRISTLNISTLNLEIGMPATTTKPEVLLPDEQPLAQYRSVAPLAVASVILGIVSSLILTTPLLAPLPVAGLVAGIAALRSIRRSGEQLAGRSVAIAGLCLATFFLGLGLARHLARQSSLEQRATEMADVFLRLVEENKVQQAHQFRVSPALRITAPGALVEHYEKNAEAAKELQGFVGSAVVKDIIARGKDADIRFESVASATHEGQADMLILKYTYVPKAGGERQPIWVHINRRFDETTKRNQWEVGGVQNTAPVGMTE